MDWCTVGWLGSRRFAWQGAAQAAPLLLQPSYSLPGGCGGGCSPEPCRLKPGPSRLLVSSGCSRSI
jgi:hypothetical protein